MITSNLRTSDLETFLILNYSIPPIPLIPIYYDPLYIKLMMVMLYKHVLNYSIRPIGSGSLRWLGLQSCTV
jgi:hypothetical protein